MLTKGRKLKGGENIRGKFETEGGIESSGRRRFVPFVLKSVKFESGMITESRVTI